MRYCEMETQGPVLGFCDQRATAKIEGHWYCPHHADALEQASERWSGIHWFPLTNREIGQQPNLSDPDGRFWDDDTEDSL